MIEYAENSAFCIGVKVQPNSFCSWEYCRDIDATLDHADNSVWAEQFLAAAEADAFFEKDIDKIISVAMKAIPKDGCFNSLYKQQAPCKA